MTSLFDMSNKICFKCNIDKPLEEFYKHSEMADGRLNKCKECAKNDANLRFNNDREKIRDYDTTRQRYSIKRILRHRYNSMTARVQGRGKHPTISIGMPVLTWLEFMEWHESNIESFQSIYDDWVESGFIRKLAPSIDRIDNESGYLADNMQWITQSENSRKYNKVIS